LNLFTNKGGYNQEGKPRKLRALVFSQNHQGNDDYEESNELFSTAKK
jgi:hypothetical protein